MDIRKYFEIKEPQSYPCTMTVMLTYEDAYRYYNLKEELEQTLEQIKTFYNSL